ncbi:MAG: ABC transporter ATP-binding protein [Bacillota bacterium]|jgi:iron complex transport system ATP-binding protein
MNILQVEQLCVSYGKASILHKLDLAIAAEKITTIIGPNGCGKSTLLKALGRIIKPTHGQVYLHGEELHRIPTRQIARSLAFLPQHPAAPPELTVEELIAFGRFPHRRQSDRLSPDDREVIARAMELTQVLDLRRRCLENLSGGERQRVWLAMILAQDTEILLLDEPTTYLDMTHQLEMLKIISRLNRERQCAIVMVLHDINQAARFSHQIVAMRGGTIIAAGSPLETIKSDVLRKVFRIEARVIADPYCGIPVCIGYDNTADHKRLGNQTSGGRA